MEPVTLPQCHCGQTHRTLAHRDCFCMTADCCEGGKPHCGRTSYGCWLKDLTVPDLDEIERLAKATVQGDGDFSWGVIVGHKSCPTGVWRDQCGNMPIVYDADDVDALRNGKELQEEPAYPEGKRWSTMSDHEKEEHCKRTIEFEEKLMAGKPDIALIGHMHPGRILRLVQMARRAINGPAVEWGYDGRPHVFDCPMNDGVRLPDKEPLVCEETECDYWCSRYGIDRKPDPAKARPDPHGFLKVGKA